MSLAGERRLGLLARLVDGERVDTRRLCAVSAEATGAAGAGLMLMSGDLPRGSICTSDEVSGVLERLQFELGEGPCVDAHHAGRPVLEPDLAHPGTSRWPAFTGPALDAGARSVFGFALRIGAVRIGALNLYRARTGDLSDVEHANALVMADIASQTILLLQSQAPPGALALELEANADFQYVVHQAAGMVAAQLDVTVGTALLRLRAHAFTHGDRLTELARAVVDREMRFDATTGEAADRPTITPPEPETP